MDWFVKKIDSQRHRAHRESFFSLLRRRRGQKTRDFFQSIDIKTKISDYTDDTSSLNDTIVTKFKEKSFDQIGENQSIGNKELIEILNLSV